MVRTTRLAELTARTEPAQREHFAGSRGSWLNVATVMSLESPQLKQRSSTTSTCEP